MTGTKPNILLIMSDQHRADAMGCAGHPVVQTPAMDALAARGVRFGRTIVQAPVCMAARSSFATGRYVRDHGVYDNNQDLEPGTPTLMRSLHDAGYWTSCIGKMHLSSDETRACVDEPLRNPDLAGQMRDLGFDEPHLGPDKVGITGMPSEYQDYLREEGLFERFCEWFEPYRYGRMSGNDRRTAPMWTAEPSPLPPEAHIDAWIGRRVARWIEEYDRDEPFFQWVGISGPHDPWDPPSEYIDRYRDVDIPLGSLVPPAIPESGPLRRLTDLLRSFGSWDTLTPDILREVRRNYYANLTLIDESVARMIEALERKGIADNTWVLYTSDHGEMLGDHMTLTKMVFYRQALEVPLIVVPPRGTDPRVVDGMVQHLDVTATIEAIAGADGLPGAEGRSLLGHVTGERDAPLRDVAYSENYGFGMIATADYKIVFFEETKEPVQLFDLRADPEENNDVLLDPHYADARKQMITQYVEPFLATPPVVRSPGYMGLTVTAPGPAAS